MDLFGLGFLIFNGRRLTKNTKSQKRERKANPQEDPDGTAPEIFMLSQGKIKEKTRHAALAALKILLRPRERCGRDGQGYMDRH